MPNINKLKLKLNKLYLKENNVHRHEVNYLMPVFWVSLCAIIFEIALTRYFAIANWSEYGYWVISITMVGFSFSGVILSLFKNYFERHSQLILYALPILMMAAVSLGYHFITINPFNPLELQNPLFWSAQLLNICKYYLALFPFFFMAGMYIGLYFIICRDRIPRVYAADLTGAGLGAIIILIFGFLLHPFHLPLVLPPILAMITLLYVPEKFQPIRLWVSILTVVICLSGEFFLIVYTDAKFNEYKSIYPVLNVKGNRIVAEIKSPRGMFTILDNFTERLDIDVSNNLELLKIPGPPNAYGVYRDGNRITSLPKFEQIDPAYVKGALDAAPFFLLNSPRTLLIGTRGGSRMAEALFLGSKSLLAIEPDVTIYELVSRKKDHSSAFLNDPRIKLMCLSPMEIAVTQKQRFDLIDISSDFLDQSFSNKYVFTVDVLQYYFDMLTENGLVSIPVSIREFSIYALKMLATARQALDRLNLPDPGAHLAVYRSAWNARVLIAKKPFTKEQIERLIGFCDKRSFDISFYPGINPDHITTWNDLPLITFNGSPDNSSHQSSDALLTQSLELLAQKKTSAYRKIPYNIEPATFDRPFFYYILDLQHLGVILKNISLIPHEELGFIVNLAVLIQALLLAIVILLLPIIRWQRKLPRFWLIVKSVLYFACLGLGFLFIEILLIEKVSFFLNDFNYAFAMVLASMLMFSGLGSYIAGRYLNNPRRGVILAGLGVILWLWLAYILLDRILLSLIAIPFVWKCIFTVGIIAPLAIALGMPFPLGLYMFRDRYNTFLPWAWSLNGAFSVISTPLANLIVISSGYHILLWCSGGLYLIVLFMYPAVSRQYITNMSSG